MPDTAVRKKFFVSDKWASEREPTILWVGRALPRKGLRLAIDVFSEVRKRVPRARLVVAGNGPTIRADVDHAATLGVADGVDWLGWVDDQELCRLYRTSRLMLFSSLRDTLGSQVFEAMAGALPIVALDRGGVHDFVPAAAGAKVSASTPDELVSRLSKECISLLEDGERWHKASIAASEAAEQFTENRALEAMELIYSQALATKDVT